jgi:hypothetical protein
MKFRMLLGIADEARNPCIPTQGLILPILVIRSVSARRLPSVPMTFLLDRNDMIIPLSKVTAFDRNTPYILDRVKSGIQANTLAEPR